VLPIPVAIAALCAVGIMLLSGGVYRVRTRDATSRRVAEVLGERPTQAAVARLQRPNVWRLEAQHLLAELEARGDALRGPAIGLACVCALIGLAGLSPAWLALAVACGIAAYALGAGDRRRHRIEAQALATMDLLASGLRAGYSVPQAIELVARHSPEPTASEFAVAGQEIALGIPLYEAIGRLARRTANKDYQLVAIIIRVQHEVGGNLAHILDSVGSTLRERFELRRQVNALTAQQRLASTVLTVLPYALLLFLFVMDRSFVEPLFTAPLGRLILAAAAAMMFVGWAFMRGVGRVEV
jgi:tight adherence protein B